MKLELVSELRTLALLLRQGEAPSRALGRLASRSTAWRPAAEAAERGAALAAALESVLPQGLSRAVGQTPDPPGVLDEVARLVQLTVRRRRKWGSVMAYPLFLLVTLAGLLGFGHFATQPLVELYEGMSVRIPPLTRLVIGLMKGVSDPAVMVPVLGFVLLPLLGVLWLIFGWSYSRLLLPLLGQELRHQEAQGFLSWLAFLVQSGAPLPEAVRAAAEGCSARPMKRQMLRCAEELERGAEIEAAVRVLTWFPGLARWLIASSFRTPSPGAALQEASRLLARDSELQLGNSGAVIETVLMLLIGLIVAVAVLAFFLPLYQLIGNLS